jgi:hypothetical protein
LVIRLLERIAVATLQVSAWILFGTLVASVLFALFLAAFVATAYAKRFGVPPVMVAIPLAVAVLAFSIWLTRHVKRIREIHDALAVDGEVDSEGEDDERER